jgi:cytochrome P450
MTLLFAGHDTTTSTLTFLMYELARHPDWAAKLAAETDPRFEAQRVTPDRYADRIAARQVGVARRMIS